MKKLFFLIFLQIILHINHRLNAAIYYVDAISGNDLNDGTLTTSAWQTISKVNTVSFVAGDQILFRSGQEFFGSLVPKSSGNSNFSITFGSYGAENRPVINGRNFKKCIDASGKQYLIFKDLELKNDSKDDNSTIEAGADSLRYGFYAHVQWGNVVRKNIMLDNIKISRIYPSKRSIKSEEYNGYGIYITSDGGGNNNYYDGITIQNCEITDIASVGISINKWIPVSPPANQFHKNIIIKNNYVHHIGGSGVVFFNIDGFTIENNIFIWTGYYSPFYNPVTGDNRQAGTGSGYWGVRCYNGIIQHNEFSHVRGPGDSCGAHIDIDSHNVIIQYNLSLDNAGGFAEFMGAITDCIYRYNVSINDGFRVKWVSPATKTTNPEMYSANGDKNFQTGKTIWFSDYTGPNGEVRVGSTNNQVYNNTIYIGSGINSNIVFENNCSNNEIYNNIFYIDGNLSYSKTSSSLNNLFDGNLWYGNYPVTIPFGTKDIRNINPNFINKGSLLPADYKILSNSAAINKGVLIPNNGERDYFGHLLLNTPDIGAIEYESISTINDFFKNNSLSVHPNPATSNLEINITKNNIGTSYAFYNQLGQVILKGLLHAEKTNIELNNISSGLYVFSLDNDPNSKIKIIKQ